MTLDRVLSEGSPVASVAAAAQTAVSTTAGAILAANPFRKGLRIQNTGTTVIYLLLGAGTPTASVNHVQLKACASAHDGTGGVFESSTWVGSVQAIGSGLGGTVVIMELATGSPDWNLAGNWGSSGF